MSDNQLREAYALMKQGDKKAAARLVQDILREDRNNVNAWWLFSHLLEDEEKVVKAMERVLALNPEHAGARKRLASMRPEYAHLAQAPTVDSPEQAKSKNQDAYWEKLSNSAKRKQGQNPSATGLMGTLVQSMGLGFAIRLGFFLIIGLGVAVFGIISFIDKQVTLADTAGETPETITLAYIDALYRGNYDAVYEMSCPEFYPELEAIIDNFSESNREGVSLDLSNTNVELFNYTDGELAYVTVHGTTIVERAGVIVTIDWDENATAENVDFYGVHFRRVEGLWKVCVEYFIPMVEHRSN